MKIKTHVGTSKNALFIQTWTALTAMLPLKILALRARCGWTLSNLVALLRWNLFTYRDLWHWLDRSFATTGHSPPGERLRLLDSITFLPLWESVRDRRFYPSESRFAPAASA